MRRYSGQRHHLSYYLLFAWCAATVIASMPAAHAQPLPALSALDNNNARVTALVVNLADMTTIAALNPDQRLTPASVSKLFAAAGALQQFGPDHRFVTRFASQGTVRAGVLHGNLIFVGGGDPALDTTDLRRLITQLKAAGVHHVTGDLVVDNSLFGPFSCFIEDRCDARTRASSAYSAPLSSVGVNYGTVEINVYPGAHAGDASRVVLTPLDLPGYTIDNRVTTGAAGIRPRLAVWREYTDGRDILHLRGTLPAGGRHYSIYRAVANAASQTANILSTLLADAGIGIEGGVTISAASGSELATLAKINGDSLGQMLIPMLAYSNNYMADTLTRDIAAARGHSGNIKLAQSAQTLQSLSRTAMLESYPQQAQNT